MPTEDTPQPQCLAQVLHWVSSAKTRLARGLGHRKLRELGRSLASRTAERAARSGANASQASSISRALTFM